MRRCPFCQQRASTHCGCCARCAERLFAPQQRGFELWLGSFDGGLEPYLHALKFKQQRNLANPFGQLLAQEIRRSAWRADIVCAVPLHTVRFMKRGYNQSALIGRALARELDLPYRSLLKRTRRTRQQAKLGRDARLTNLQNAFHAQPLRGEAVLLVDDVYTTGATVTECALELLCKGAGRVYIATVARA